MPAAQATVAAERAEELHAVVEGGRDVACRDHGSEREPVANGDLVNQGLNATASGGRIALQAEGTEVEFRRVEIRPLPSAGK